MENSMKMLGIISGFLLALSLSSCSDMPARSGTNAKNWPVSEREFNASLPDDVFPDSRSRLPIVDRADLDDEGKAIYDRYMSPDSTSLAGIQGPGGIRLHRTLDKSPSRIDRKTEELVRLVISREMDQVFEWTMHEPVALKEGLDPEIIDVIRYRRSLAGMPEKEASIIQLGREVFQQHKVSSETYARVLEQFGKRDLIAITELMGRGVTTFILLYAFDLHLPYDREPLLPIP
jgi:4-carboxymuconolactone decarboxylase